MINTAAIKNQGVNAIHKITGASVQDIVRQTRANEKLAMAALKDVSQQFKGATNADTYRNIWNFLKHHVTYKADTGAAQIIKLPAALVKSGGDCKSFSLFTVGVLNNLGLKSKYRLTTYDPARPNNAHIYVVTNDGYIIDAVFDRFNAEKPYFTAKDYPTMTQLSTIGATHTVGATFSQSDFINAIGNGKFTAAFAQTIRTILSTGFAMKGFARGMRFLIIWAFQNNVGNLATNFSKVKTPQKDIVRRIYYAVLGSIATLDSAAAVGKNRPAITNVKGAINELRNDLKKVSDSELTKGTSEAAKIWRGSKVGEPLEIVAAAGTAAATILALVKYLNEETALLDKAGAGKDNTPLDTQIIALKKQGYPDAEAAKVANTTTTYVAKVWAAYNASQTDTPPNESTDQNSGLISKAIAAIVAFNIFS